MRKLKRQSATGLLCRWSADMFSIHRFRKVPKFSDTKNFCCKLPNIQTKRPNLRLFCQNGAKGNSKQWRPSSDCSLRSSLIWVCTVCPDLSVWKLRVITVVQSCLWGFRPGLTQTGLYEQRSWQEPWIFGFWKKMDQLGVYCTAYLRLLFSHMQKAGFLMTLLIWKLLVHFINRYSLCKAFKHIVIYIHFVYIFVIIFTVGKMVSFKTCLSEWQVHFVMVFCVRFSLFSWLHAILNDASNIAQKYWPDVDLKTFMHE